ncbi:unnamed protein product [Vitrella brassicaformis CCMP3155]|uniref:CHCH domain-containing protein n=2 Tax=Vitrella brassicaformis TaxID=1169539 RepID=A0A0G4EH06_VITBC|nr:unnamed protein product [Vitrella brassicaformis CCMP3155]|mmetsp:Transcript_2049/g.4594  ORF Transcript_2049/g.4594 Transcript_2049/m.4594 type:complete len:100 (+) Transcript_2049:134-433(+)|eukprot:CEL94959.1 unnamed protein product [Vitrella brassicaformis CCMP3155]
MPLWGRSSSSPSTDAAAASPAPDEATSTSKQTPQAADARQAFSRKECWEARDVYFACLDQHGGDAEQCKKEKEAFEAKCLVSWQKHFLLQKQYRVALPS